MYLRNQAFWFVGAPTKNYKKTLNIYFHIFVKKSLLFLLRQIKADFQNLHTVLDRTKRISLPF